MKSGKKEKKETVFTKGKTDDEKVSRFVAGGLFSTAATAFSGLFGLLWLITLTAKLGPQDYGIMGPIFNGFWPLCALVSMGVNLSATAYVSHHYEKEFEESKKYAVEGNKYMVLFGVGFMLLTILVSVPLRLMGMMSTLWMVIIIEIALAAMFCLFWWGVLGAINGFQRLDFVAIGNMTFPIGMFVFSLLFVMLAQKFFGAESQWDIAGATLGLAMGGASAWVISLILFPRCRVMPLREIYRFRISHGLFKKIIKLGGISTIANIAYTILQGIAPVIVGFLAISLGLYGAHLAKIGEKLSGYFSASWQYSMAPLLVMGITFALMPAISEAHAQGRKDLMQQYFDITMKYAFIFTIAFFSAYASLGGHIVEFFSGPKYPASVHTPIIIPLALGFNFLAFCYLFMFLFIGLKRPHIPAMVIPLVNVILIIILLLFSYLVHNINILGWSLVISGGIGFSIMIWYLIKRVGLKIKFWLYTIPAMAAIPTWALAYFVLPKKGLAVAVDLIIIGVVFTLLYLFFGGLEETGVDQFRNNLQSINNSVLNFIGRGMIFFIVRSPFYEWYKRWKF